MAATHNSLLALSFLLFATVCCREFRTPEHGEVEHMGEDFFDLAAKRAATGAKRGLLVEFYNGQEQRLHLSPQVCDTVEAPLRKLGIDLAAVNCETHWRVCEQFPFLDSYPNVKLIQGNPARVIEFRVRRRG